MLHQDVGNVSLQLVVHGIQKRCLPFFQAAGHVLIPPYWSVERCIWICLGHRDFCILIGWRVVPHPSKRFLLLKHVNLVKVVLCTEVSGQSELVQRRKPKVAYFAAVTPPGPAPTTATLRILETACELILSDLANCLEIYAKNRMNEGLQKKGNHDSFRGRRRWILLSPTASLSLAVLFGPYRTKSHSKDIPHIIRLTEHCTSL